MGIIYWQDRNLLQNESISFESNDGLMLQGTYYSGDLSAGIIILEGFGSDQTMMRNIVSEFIDYGLHLFTFDFSGHGNSEGTIGFDNAQKDTLANQILTAKEKFKSLSGLEDEEIIMIGHSMGARMALEAASYDSNPALGLALIGTQVNLEENIQASFFTGVNDIDLNWVQNLSSEMPQTDIFLISGSWDDIITPNAADLLYNKLTEESNGPYERVLKIVPGVFHNYEIYSYRVLSNVKSWIFEEFNLTENLPESSLQANKTIIRVSCWLISIIAIFLLLYFISSYLAVNRCNEINQNSDTTKITEINIAAMNLKIDDPNIFLKYKLLMWIPTLLVFMILASILIIIPLGQPVFNLIYVGFIGSNGILLFLMYSKEKIRGITGKIILQQKYIQKPKKYLKLVVVFFGILIYLIILFRSGIGNVFPIKTRGIWLIIYGFISAIGFFVGQKEYTAIQALSPDNDKKKTNFLATLINFLPFLLLLVLYISILSLSGFLGSLQGLIILALVYRIGDLLQKIGNNPLLTSLMQGFLLQLLILPQGALFSIF